MPDVPDDDEHYKLTFKMEIEGVEYNITDAYKVWPRWVHLAALRVSDLKPFQRFKIHAKQPGVDDLTLTDAKGECMVFLKKPAALEVTAKRRPARSRSGSSRAAASASSRRCESTRPRSWRPRSPPTTRPSSSL